MSAKRLDRKIDGRGGGIEAVEEGTVPAFNYQRRRNFTRYLRGDGIEIGALHNPLDVSDREGVRVRYVDRFPIASLRKHYPELKNYHLAPVDIVDDGQTLATIPDESLDFIIANSMIEHCDNPLGTLEHWCAKLKYGGVIYLTVPDKRVGWDERRPVTSLAHLMEDYRCSDAERRERNVAHFEEFTRLLSMNNLGPDRPHRRVSAQKKRVAEAIAADYSIHFHVFTFESFREMLRYAHETIGLSAVLIAAAPPIPESWESIFVLRKVTAEESDIIPEIQDDVRDPEQDRIMLAKTSIRIGQLEAKQWQAETDLWEANSRNANLETRLWQAETDLWEANRHTWDLESRLWQAETDLWQVQSQLWEAGQHAWMIETQLWQAETDRWEANRRIADLETRKWQAETDLWEANSRNANLETRLWQAETDLWEANRRAGELETGVWQAETRLWQAETRLWQAETDLWEANSRNADLETRLWQAETESGAESARLHAVIAEKDENATFLESRLQHIEEHVIKQKDEYIASLESNLRSLEASILVRATYALRRLVRLLRTLGKRGSA